MDKMPDEIPSLIERAQEEIAVARSPWYLMGKTGICLLGVYSLLLLLFGLLTWWVWSNPVNAWDVSITRNVQAITAPWFRISMIAISYPGSSFLQLLLILLTALIFWLLGLRLEAMCVFVLSLVSSLLNETLKLLVARSRPSTKLVEIIQHVSGKSFPSGHVMSYVAFWGLLFSFGIILFDHWKWWRILLLLVSAFFVLTVGLSRVYLGAHWTSDVLGAYLIGGVLLGLTLSLYLWIRRRRIQER